MDDLLTAAMAAVDEQRYMFEPGRAQLPQTTRPELVARVLRMLDAEPGQRILEVGTGSGYSTALLSYIVGNDGQVVSLDVDPTVTDRAQRLLDRDDRGNVLVLQADGRFGHAAGAPYDRLVAWAAAVVVPPVWVEQVRPGGVIVSPLRRDPPIVVRLTVLPGGSLREEAAIRTGFTPLTPEPFRPWESSEYGRPQPPHWTPEESASSRATGGSVSTGSRELIGGRERRAIDIVLWSADWRLRYEHERQRIVDALGANARRIEHVGSTAVDDLAAKPIVDIQVSVADVEDEKSYLPQLEQAGYVLRVREPNHRMLRTPALDAHVHICSVGSSREERHLLFRDWLRHNADDRRAYEDLKRDLALRDWADMSAYADAKSAFIEQVTARARGSSWATRWRFTPT